MSSLGVSSVWGPEAGASCFACAPSHRFVLSNDTCACIGASFRPRSRCSLAHCHCTDSLVLIAVLAGALFFSLSDGRLLCDRSFMRVPSCWNTQTFRSLCCQHGNLAHRGNLIYAPSACSSNCSPRHVLCCGCVVCVPMAHTHACVWGCRYV
jgi:hypothetical protein